MATIGFVGLGMMGSRMVKRLLDAGHTVIGHNRTKSRAQWLIEAGMQWADTPREAAVTTDFIFSNMANNGALLSVTGGQDGIIGALTHGQIYIDMGTVNPGLIQELARQVTDRGAFMLDAPVSGSKLTLEQGKLTIMVSGDKSAFERAKGILEAIGPTVIYIGESGQAMALKLAINISIGTQILALIEGVLLAEGYGIPRKTSLEVMLNSAIASPALKYRGPFIAEMPDEAWFDVDMMQKDISLALELSHELGIPLPTTSVTSDMLSAANDMGLSDKDFAILYRVLENMSRMKE